MHSAADMVCPSPELDQVFRERVQGPDRRVEDCSTIFGIVAEEYEKTIRAKKQFEEKSCLITSVA
jgi:hypothetical protein